MPKKWENNWSIKLSDEERVNRNWQLLTLGNLTIITNSLNSSIRDSDWNTKKIGKGRNKGLLEYSAGVEIFNKYLSLHDWNEDSIRDRANFLAEKATQVVWKV